MDVVVCGLFDVLHDVGIVILRPRCLKSLKSKMRGRGLVAHVKDNVGSKAPDELMVAFGSGCNDLIPRKLCKLDCVLPDR